MSDASPVAAAEFAAAMAGFAPFEPSPIIGVAVSGGGDSMALLRLTADWAAAQGGRAVALVVDHALRPESAQEAERVAQWCRQLNIEAIGQRWTNPEPEKASLQNRAREARYRLLEEACGARDILHLATGHHAGDQGETLLLRLAAGSGADGMAGIAPVTYLETIRVIRPFLDFVPERLKATCRALGQDWIEDPSNVSSRFARARVRASWSVLEAEGLTVERLAASARSALQGRAALSRLAAQALATCATIYPQGYARVERCIWTDLDPELRVRALRQLVQAIGGLDYAPPADAAEQIAARRAAGANTRVTIGNCVIEPGHDALLIMREWRNMPAMVDVCAGGAARWDRFVIRSDRALNVCALGDDAPADLASSVPRLVQRTQPLLTVDGAALAIPTLGWYAPGVSRESSTVRFAPANAATAGDFAIV